MIGGAIAGATAAINAANAAPSSDPKSSKMKLWAAATTPCDKNLKLDLGAMRDQVEWYKSHGADGMTFFGSTGQMTGFTVAEHKAVAETVGKAKGKLNVLATASTANVQDTIELCKHAADHGADGVIVSPPYYVKGISNEGMLRYYTMVLDGLPKSLPFYLYHVPRWTMAPIPVEVVKQLRRYGNIAGLKDSTTDAKGYTNFVTNFPDLSIITGTMKIWRSRSPTAWAALSRKRAPIAATWPTSLRWRIRERTFIRLTRRSRPRSSSFTAPRTVWISTPSCNMR
jgi:hypothetical protein